jgi:four helix bundle protein
MAPVRPAAGKRHLDLKSWQACRELFRCIYAIVRRWELQDRSLLGTQLTRAALSAVTNVAEGCAKPSRREFRRFLGMALGSLSEISALLLSARDVGVLSSENWGEIEALRDHANRLTYGLFRAVGRQVAGVKTAD